MIEKIAATAALTCVTVFFLSCIADVYSDCGRRPFLAAAQEWSSILFVFALIAYGVASVWSL